MLIATLAVTAALAAGEKVVDLDVEPSGDAALALVANGKTYYVARWPFAGGALEKTWTLPAGVKPSTLAIHPAASRFFVLAEEGAAHEILAVDTGKAPWTAKKILTSKLPLRRLLVGARPFGDGPDPHYRLFFGRKDPGGYSIQSVTETGGIPYQPLGATVDQSEGAAGVAPFALPLSMHPAGHMMIWEDAAHCLKIIQYYGRTWGEDQTAIPDPCRGTATFTNNGLGLVRWSSGMHGATLTMTDDGSGQTLAPDQIFLQPPAMTPDGTRLVGVTAAGKGQALVAVPVHVPLADVRNAWMFVNDTEDRERLMRDGGLLRQVNWDQLYSMYDSELYSNDYPSYPVKPYLVTTDVFWEVLAAAYEGLFVVLERQVAIPEFWKMTEGMHEHFQKTAPKSKWAGVFAALHSFHGPEAQWSDEAKRIDAASAGTSSVWNDQFTFTELKPRGPYSSDAELRAYFKGFKYLTSGEATGDELAELAAVPAPLKANAGRWIQTYRKLISASRRPLVWDAPKDVEKATLFPLGWGFDNEALFRAVFHEKFPKDQQILETDGKTRRLLPTGLDFFATLGNAFATAQLKAEGYFQKYPNLEHVLGALRPGAGWREGGAAPPTIYDQWLDALATQSDSSYKPPKGAEGALWPAKRLLTALASWATLRHATVLVNERSAAEAGEGGFEDIHMEEPHGYVEPDPATFAKIAGLLDGLAAVLKDAGGQVKGTVPEERWTQDKLNENLVTGIEKRLAAAAAEVRAFGAMAAKEVKGESLTDDEDKKVLFIGRVVEHDFLIFKSLANKEFALSTPKPVPKVADVAGDPSFGYLLAGVGAPFEWRQLVPFKGRRQAVKGVTYSYYEKVSNTLMDDEEWRQQLGGQPLPAWIAPYVKDERKAKSPG